MAVSVRRFWPNWPSRHKKPTVHSILDKDNWTYDELKLFLEKDASSVNEHDSHHKLVPLHRLLKSENFSLDCLKLLVHYGADVNYSDRDRGETAMSLAIYRNDPDAIRFLVEAGNQEVPLLMFPLSLAFQKRASVEVIKTLLECGARISLFREHVSVLHYAAYYGLKADVCELLLQIVPPDKLNARNRDNQSLMCVALLQNTEISALRMLLRAGCSLTCRFHDSAFLCATAYSSSLTSDLVKFLQDAGSDISITNNINETPLQCALSYCRYEIGAIKSLLDLQGKNARLEVLLLNAASNLSCEMDVIKFLIDKGSCVKIKNERGRTPLHLVVSLYSCTLEIVKLLLEHGACVSDQDMYGKTPFALAFYLDRDLDILELLLKAGSRLRHNNFEPYTENLLSMALDRYTLAESEPKTQRAFDVCKLFFKYAFLEDISFDVESIVLEHPAFLDFTRECVKKLREMQAASSHNRFDLYQYINRSDALIQRQMVVVDERSPGAECYDFEEILQLLADCNFKVYLDVIASKLGRDILELRVKKMTIYTAKRRPDSSVVKLNYECVCKIIQNLYNEDLLRLIIASNFPN